jgi:radical SAM superfamily enzyme YgiQ (UPF0313 family)
MLSVNKKTLYLINPSSGTTFSGLSECMDILGYRSLCPNLALPTLAALVDETYFNIVLCDENVEPVDFGLACDIVGLTVHHYQRERALQIARVFKEQGKLVVMGGSYATLSPIDRHPLIDVLFRGEAERTWPQFLADYLQGCQRTIYEEKDHADIDALPRPRLDLMRNERYLLGIIQVSRGCPYKCEFCDSVVLMGRKIRYKNNEQIIAELGQLHRLGYRSIFIADDNFTADKHRVKQILTIIRDWNNALDEPVMFSTNVSIDIVRHPELVSLLSEALVLNIFVGIESPNRDSLNEAGKFHNLRGSMLLGIELLHSRGLDVSAGMIVGFDHDNPTIFQAHADFIRHARIPICFAGMLLAPEGTPLKERLIREGRYIETNLAGDHSFDSNIIPAQMSTDELRSGYFRLMNQLYDEQNFIERVKDLLAILPQPHPLQRRYKSREHKKLRRFLPLLGRLTFYYMTHGQALRRMFIRSIFLVLKYRGHTEMIVYWLIAYKHFRRILIKHGVWKKNPKTFC